MGGEVPEDAVVEVDSGDEDSDKHSECLVERPKEVCHSCKVVGRPLSACERCREENCPRALSVTPSIAGLWNPRTLRHLREREIILNEKGNAGRVKVVDNAK